MGLGCELGGCSSFDRLWVSGEGREGVATLGCGGASRRTGGFQTRPYVGEQPWEVMLVREG